jgi:DNA-binding MarR family transcriptional regulator
MSIVSPSTERLANLIGALVLTLDDRLRDATETAAGHGAAAPAALVALHEFLGHGTMDQLRRAVGLTPSGAVRLVDRLEQSGYVERHASSDKRAVALVLTSSGRAAARRVRAARHTAIESALSELSTADRSSLTKITEKLLAVITRQRLTNREQGNEPAGGWICRLCDFEACGRQHGTCPAATTSGASKQLNKT